MSNCLPSDEGGEHYLYGRVRCWREQNADGHITGTTHSDTHPYAYPRFRPVHAFAEACSIIAR
eukprot:1187536-Prorocentrum_minimum.AAC.1